MNQFFKTFVIFSVVFVKINADDTDVLLEDLFGEISNALNAGAPYDSRQQYYKPNNGISLGVYEALRSIARNDELECVSRLLCEAAAGGQPGYSGKQIQFDKTSLTNLISYLRLDSSSSSPLLVFGRAALLGVSNRGDPYSCIINYPKCPKDQSRLLYYLNNHRGGFFQYFDKKYQKPGNYYYQQNQYRPVNYYQNYQNKYNRNKIKFENSNNLYEKYKKKALDDNYAKKYTYSKLNFYEGNRNKNYKPMVFPDDRTYASGVDPRILTKLIRIPLPEKDFVFASTSRFPKQLYNLNFFPEKVESFRQPANYVTDRLPSRFYFPESKQESYFYSDYPVRYSPNSFFPKT